MPRDGREHPRQADKRPTNKGRAFPPKPDKLKNSALTGAETGVRFGYPLVVFWLSRYFPPNRRESTRLDVNVSASFLQWAHILERTALVPYAKRAETGGRGSEAEAT